MQFSVRPRLRGFISAQYARNVSCWRKVNLAGIAMLLLAIPALSFAALPDNIRFRHIGPGDGMSQSYVYTITQDDQGFMWFGTQSGLNRFDGYEFEVFRNEEGNDSSLQNDNVRVLVITDDGTLWAGTSMGLSRFERSTHQFTNFALPADGDGATAGNSIRALLADKSGRLWVGTDGGLKVLTPGTDVMASLEIKANSVAQPEVRSIITLGDAGLLLGTSDGPIVVDTNSGRSEPFGISGVNVPSSCSGSLRKVYRDDRDRVWLGTVEDGVCLVSADGIFLRVFRNDVGDKNTLSDNEVNDILQDDKDVVWVATNRGLNAYSEPSNSFKRFEHKVDELTSINHSTVHAIFQNKAGLLWFGTYAGASYWDSLTAVIQRFSADPGGEGGLASNEITGFAEDARGHIWVATANDGVSILDKETRKFRSIEVLKDETRAGRAIEPTSIQFTSDYLAWIGTRRSGLQRLDTRTGTLSEFRYDGDTKKGLSSDEVVTLYVDSAKQLWISSYGSGLHRYDSDSNNFYRWQHSATDPSTISSNRIFAICDDRKGNLWLGHLEAGLDRLNLSTGRIERIFAGTDLETAGIMWIQEDRGGDLWMATLASGLIRWSAENRANDNRVFERFGEREAASYSAIYGGLIDQSGNVWLATVRGLSKFVPADMRFEYFDTSHGLLNTEFTYGAVLASSTGELYFGGDNGFSSFLPDELAGSDYPPGIEITGVKRLDRAVDLLKLRREGGVLELTHRDYLLEIELAALDFSAPEKNRYRYRLDGWRDQWVDSDTQRRITYTNLEAGNYVFRAQAVNNYGVWSDKEATLEISVLAAPWRTWWAYATYALSILLLAGLFFRAHAARLRQNAAELHADQVESINRSLTNEISARKEKEVQLEAARERAETYFNVAEVLLMTLGKDGNVLRINKKGASLIGKSTAAIEGSGWIDYLPEEWQEPVRTELLGMLDDQRKSVHDYFEFPILGPGGREYLIAWNCTTLITEGSERVLFCSGMDVTRVRSLEKQMRIREKMNAIGTLAGGIAHDFNNILQAIYGFTTLALDSIEPGDEKAAYLRQVVKGADRARNLVKRILTFSNQKEYDLKSMDLGPVVKEAGALLRGSLPATVEIEIDVADERIPVRADPTRMHQVIMNLGTNAGQAMSDSGGILNISLQRVDFSSEDIGDQSKLHPGAHMMIRVRDTGVGMTAQTLDHIYDPFFTTKDTSENTGLGLTVVHGIVQSHGGDMEVGSKPGEGTEFRVYLPSSDRIEAIASDHQDSRTRGSERILLVDDEDWVLTVTSKLLKGQGYDIVTSSSGDDAVALIAERAGAFHLMVTDETMPKMTGSQLTERVRTLAPDIPVLIISGKLAPEAVAGDKVWFLQKPFTTEEISGRIREILDGKAD